MILGPIRPELGSWSNRTISKKSPNAARLKTLARSKTLIFPHPSNKILLYFHKESDLYLSLLPQLFRMEALCMSESNGNLVVFSMAELVLAQTVLAVQTSLLWAASVIASLPNEHLDIIKRALCTKHKSSPVAAAAKDDGDSDNDEDEDDSDAEEGAGDANAEEDSDDEEADPDAEEEEDADPEANGGEDAAGEDDDDDDDDDDEDGDDDGDEDDEEEEEEEEEDEDVPQPPAKKRK